MKKKMKLMYALAALIVLTGCGTTATVDPGSPAEPNPEPDTTSSQPSENQLERFVGVWTGKYSGIDDQITIQKTNVRGEYQVDLHQKFSNPDSVIAHSNAENQLEIRNQNLGGAAGTATLTFKDGKLMLEQKGLGMTVRGTYTRASESKGHAKDSIGQANTNNHASETSQQKAVTSTSLPDDIPVFPESEETMSFGKRIKSVRFKTFKSAKDIHDFYINQLTQNDWEIGNDGTLTIQASKGIAKTKGFRKRTVTISVLTPRDPRAIQATEFVIQYND